MQLNLDKMKKYILYAVVLIAMTNCSNELFAQSAKDKFDALNDYLETVERFSAKKIIVVKEKVSANMTIDILKANDIGVFDSTGKGKSDPTFYNVKDWEIMKKKFENQRITAKDHSFEDKCWTDNDFRHKEIVFVSVKGITWEDAFKSYDSGINFDVFSFSEPVYYKKRSYLVFTIRRADVIGGFGGTTAIVFMQKRKGKWVKTHMGLPDWHN